MKTIISVSAAICILFTACNKTSLTEKDDISTESRIDNRTCASYEKLAAAIAADPGIKQRRDQLEAFTKNAESNGTVNSLGANTIVIPVVVNVLYNTPAENISIQQIQSQIDVLNEDFNKRNSDVGDVPSIYKNLTGNAGINFVLHAVVRKQVTKKSWPPNDGMKKLSGGGIPATDPEHLLNIWVCNLGQNLLGYAYYPQTIEPAMDGVVVLYSAFGSRDKFPGGTFINDYDLGRTATHEVGHWLNLAHIWGDDGGSCAGTDFVADTPNQADLNFGCPAFPHVSCNNQGDLSMNYMDYTDDACMFMFTKGQGNRMLATLVPGGPRSAYIR